jgi:hypothetical protein
VGFVNAAALVILGVLLLRKVVLMERYFEVRVYLITAFLCGLLLFALSYLLGDPPCVPPFPGEAEFTVVLCSEY